MSGKNELQLLKSLHYVQTHSPSQPLCLLKVCVHNKVGLKLHSIPLKTTGGL